MLDQIGEERFNLRFAGQEINARPHVMKMDESNDPLHIGSLAGDGVVLETEHLSNLIEKFWLTFRCVRHIRSP